jgi:hypothetical protein
MQQKLHRPRTLVRTAEDRRVIGVVAESAVAIKLPAGAIVDRTGHLLFDEQPTLLAALAAEWLDSVFALSESTIDAGHQ